MWRPAKKFLTILSIIILILTILTTIGIMTNSVVLLGFIGWLILGACFFVFRLTDKIMQFANKILDKYANQNSLVNIDVNRNIGRTAFCYLLKYIPGAALVIRSFALTSGIWIVDFYVTVIESGFMFIWNNFESKLIIMLVVIALHLNDSIKGRSLERPGFLCSIILFFGNLLFLLNLGILFFAIWGDNSLELAKIYFHDPFWFLNSDYNRKLIIAFISPFKRTILGSFCIYLFWGLLFLSWFIDSVKTLFGSSGKLTREKRILAVSNAIFVIWIMSLPLYLVVFTIIGIIGAIS